MLRVLNTAPGLRAALAGSTLLSLLGLTGTLLAWVVAARVIAAALLHREPPTLTALLTVAAGLLLRGSTQAGREWLGTRNAARSVRFWRQRSTQAALRLGPVALTAGHGSDLSLLSAELGTRLTPYYARYLPQAAHSAVAALGVLAVTLWLDPATALVLAVTGPLSVVFLALVGLAAGSETERQWQAHTRLGARLVGLTRDLPTLHAFGRVGTYRALLQGSAAAHRVTTLKVLRVAFLSGFVLDLAATLGTALAAVWIGVRLYEGHAALAPTLAALMLMPEFFGPLRQLGADRHAALDAEPLARGLNDLLALRPAPSGGVQPRPDVPELTLTGACADLGAELGADLNAQVVSLSCRLAPGTHLALLGPSGSGSGRLLARVPAADRAGRVPADPHRTGRDAPAGHPGAGHARPELPE